MHCNVLTPPVKKAWGTLKRINTPGDADDHVKIMIVGENDVLAEVEISNAVAMCGAYCTIYGDRGSLICADQKDIQLRYIDPEYKFAERIASDSQPPKVGGLGNEEQFPWIMETVNIESTMGIGEYVEVAIATHLYRAIRENIPFPIRNSDALEVVRITNMVKRQNSQFNWKV